MRLIVVALVFVVVLCDSGGAVSSTPVSGRVVDGSLPAAGRGATVVGAVDLATSRVLAAVRAKPNGSYQLRVPAGVVMVLATVVRRAGAPVTAVTAAVRVRKGHRTSLSVSLKHRKPTTPKHKKRTGKAKHATDAFAAAAASGPVIAVKGFDGSGPFSQLGRGLSSMLETDLASQVARCGGQEVEWEHRDLLQKEIDLQHQHPGLFDPSTIVSKHWLSPTVFVQGKVSTNASGGMSWDITLVDAHTGEKIGGDTGSAQASGDFTASESIADRLLDQLCPKQYEVKLQINSTYASGPFYGDAMVTADLTATGAAGQSQPTTFTGKANVTWNSLRYGSNQPECTLTPAGQTGSLEVTIEHLGDSQIKVTWGGSATSNALRSLRDASGPSRQHRADHRALQEHPADDLHAASRRGHPEHLRHVHDQRQTRREPGHNHRHSKEVVINGTPADKSAAGLRLHEVVPARADARMTPEPAERSITSHCYRAASPPRCARTLMAASRIEHATPRDLSSRAAGRGPFDVSICPVPGGGLDGRSSCLRRESLPGRQEGEPRGLPARRGAGART